MPHAYKDWNSCKADNSRLSVTILANRDLPLTCCSCNKPPIIAAVGWVCARMFTISTGHCSFKTGLNVGTLRWIRQSPKSITCKVTSVLDTCQRLEELPQSSEKFGFDSPCWLWSWASEPGHRCNRSPRWVLCYLEHSVFQGSLLCLRSVLLEKGFVLHKEREEIVSLLRLAGADAWSTCKLSR